MSSGNHLLYVHFQNTQNEVYPIDLRLFNESISIFFFELCQNYEKLYGNASAGQNGCTTYEFMSVIDILI